jgi:preprotein translocase subunit SecF
MHPTEHPGHTGLEIFGKPNIDFIGHRWFPILLSAIITFGGLAVIALKGFNYSLEFTGGTLVQVTFQQPIEVAKLRDALNARKLNPEIQSVVDKPTYILREKGTSEAVEREASEITTSLKAAFPDNPLTLDRREYIGPVVGEHLRSQTLWAIFLSLLGIVVYVAFRFSNPIWGATGVIALFHDVIGTAAFIALTGKELDLLIVSALLTIGGYSITDTIVIYDRMREKMRVLRREPLDNVINMAMNETLSRTVITVLTVQMVCVVLAIWGGKVIHNFALAMIVGNFLGSYSSIAVAAPLMFEWEKHFGDKRLMESPKTVGKPGSDGASARRMKPQPKP